MIEGRVSVKRKILKNFIIDHRGYSYAYVCSNFLIGVFYYMTFQEKIEVIYPLSLSVFIYLVWMIYQFAEYYKLQKNLEDMMRYHDYVGNYRSISNKSVNKTINELHAYYLDRLSETENSHQRERRFQSQWIHNLKTPITVTDLVIQRMEKNEIETAAGIRAIKEENKKLLTNLDTILNMVRLEEFAKDYIPGKMDLLKELNTIINNNKSLFIYHRVFPKIVTELEEAVVLSDIKWNELMLNQIISNAVKYSTQEGMSKNLWFHVDKIENKIVLTIKDEGIGIPEYDIKKVWEPFFTGDNGRRGFQSSGIGLYFCREVGRMLGHSMNISSEMGKGSKVSISYLAKL